MHFIHLYLINYFALVMNATIALWQTNVLTQISNI